MLLPRLLLVFSIYDTIFKTDIGQIKHMSVLEATLLTKGKLKMFITGKQLLAVRLEGEK